MRRYFRHLDWGTIIYAGAMITFFLVAFFVLPAIRCNNQWPGREVSYRITSGCMVMIDNEWWPAENVRKLP